MAKKKAQPTSDPTGPTTGPFYFGAVHVCSYPTSIRLLVYEVKRCEQIIDRAANGPPLTADEVLRLRDSLAPVWMQDSEWWPSIVRTPPDDPEQILNHARHDLWKRLRGLLPRAVIATAIREGIQNPERLLAGGHTADAAWMELETKAAGRRPRKSRTSKYAALLAFDEQQRALGKTEKEVVREWNKKHSGSNIKEGNLRTARSRANRKTS